MKDIMIFTRANDPYCVQAADWQRQLFLQHPEYEDLPIAVIDVEQRPDLAAQYPYSLLPTYYVGGKKVCEMPLKKERVAAVFEAAWSAPDLW